MTYNVSHVTKIQFDVVASENLCNFALNGFYIQFLGSGMTSWHSCVMAHVRCGWGAHLGVVCYSGTLRGSFFQQTFSGVWKVPCNRPYHVVSLRHRLWLVLSLGVRQVTCEQSFLKTDCDTFLTCDRQSCVLSRAGSAILLLRRLSILTRIDVRKATPPRHKSSSSLFMLWTAAPRSCLRRLVQP